VVVSFQVLPRYDLSLGLRASTSVRKGRLTSFPGLLSSDEKRHLKRVSVS
jgi:hypothetical protein